MQDHWIDVTYLRFASICGLHECTVLENDSAQVRLDAEAVSILAFATLGGKKVLRYPLLCRAIQRTLDFAVSELSNGEQSGLIVRDTAYYQDHETSDVSASYSEVRLGYGSNVDMEFEGPEPTYTTNPPFTGTCDLSLYRRAHPGSHELQQRSDGSPLRDSSAASSVELSRKAWFGRKLWNFVKAFIDVKGDESLSPFSMDIDDPNFLPDTKNATRARKELAQVAGEIMLRQHRCFLYSATIVGSYARLIRWDRSGGLVSEPIDLREDGEKLLTFIYALGRMDDTALGCDATATLATEAETRLWHNAVAAKTNTSSDWRCYLKQATNDDWPTYKLIVSDDDASIARRRWLSYIGEGTPLPQGGCRDFIVRRQSSEGRRSPFLRGCRGFVALDVTTGEFVHLKDFWHADGLERLPEFVVYARLIKAGVRNIPTFLCGGYVPGDVSGVAQTTVNHRFDSRLRGYIHGRFVVREVGRPLQSYENTFQLTAVFQQALIAHQDAWDNAGLLHGDINDRSIVIHNGRGLLTDWELTMPRETIARTPSFRNRVGTWRYLSGLLSTFPLKPHELSDDVESFMHVLLILAIRFQDHMIGPQQIGTLIDQYDEATRVGTSDLTVGSWFKAKAFANIDTRLVFDMECNTSQNFIALIERLIVLGKEHDYALPTSVLRPFLPPPNLTPEQLRTLLKTPIHNPAYTAAASRSLFKNHDKVLAVFEEILGRQDGWAMNDKSTKDAFSDGIEVTC